jgi:hypothetical protein
MLQPPKTLSSSHHLAAIVRVRVGTKAEVYDAEKHLKEKSERYNPVLQAEEELLKFLLGCLADRNSPRN